MAQLPPSETYSLCARCGAYWECGCTVQGRPVRITDQTLTIYPDVERDA